MKIIYFILKLNEIKFLFKNQVEISKKLINIMKLFCSGQKLIIILLMELDLNFVSDQTNFSLRLKFNYLHNFLFIAFFNVF